MKMRNAIAAPFLQLAIMLIAGALVSCTDSGVDSETAEYIVGGEDKDTTKLTLEKAYIQAAFLGETGNMQVGDFVEFGRVTQYRVDTLDDGSVLGLKDLHLKATFGDRNDPTVRHNFYPLRELQFGVPVLEWGIINQGPPVSLQGDPGNGAVVAGLKAIFVHKGASRDLVTSADNDKSLGYAQITGVDSENRTIDLYIKADVTNPIPRSEPNRIVDRMVVEIFLQLPY